MYLEMKEDLIWWQKQGFTFNRSGYGKKIPTTKKALYNGKWYRVYVCIFANVGTCYIVSKGVEIIVRGEL